jgi:uncharacterized protein
MNRSSAYHVMTKPSGPICNLGCSYCFYLEKEHLFPKGTSFRMAPAVLETYIRDYISSQDVPEISFAWQGGEPTILGVEYFEKVVALQEKYAGGKRILNAFQTNGTLLDDRWGAFLKQHNFLVGLSIDGPRELHDTYRVDKGGKPTFDKVMAGLAVLKKHGVEFNTLTVVNRRNARYPLDVYRFLKEVGSGFIQFIPLVERAAPPSHNPHHLDLAAPPQIHDGTDDAPVTRWSVKAEHYGTFLTTIFDEWVRHDIGRVFVQLFDTALVNWIGGPPTMCVFSETCGSALALEHNGDLYSCDHYVYPEYRLGNILNQSIGDMVRSERQQAFGTAKRDSLPGYCRRCEFRFACHGECPKHRFMTTPDGEPGLNYLCPAYKHFFRHIDPAMQAMVRLIRQGRAPAELMTQLRHAPPQVLPGRNDPCPCGSGRKFKACCLPKFT